MSVCQACRLALRRSVRQPHAHTAHLSSTRRASTAADILSKPSWSIRSLREPSSPAVESESRETITPKQLHHLLRLAALPLPQSPAEEASMIETLQSQLQFVRAVQRVDTAGVEPLRAIRDETLEAVRENTITLEDVKSLLSEEEHVGHHKRPRRTRKKTEEADEKWDVLGTASRKAGKYFVVDSSKTSQGD
ncbi:hypothetical protein E4U57_000337 [Claviceps arundinis]|uniref:Glutamyl-tRNA amidotransferase complex subunit Gta3 domain-containing protein n=1 Tax=Claviceps arundinis TaxID=1623583 RepID=A0A9P7SRN3_9HYPO|nr:hypothetical protein E4U57_000337 [Claviceps arundinis]KAG5971392.1 hypothetical protein E4U56_006801 [Claviceps arundinis]